MKPPLQKEIYFRVRSILNLSQAQLALYIGVSPRTISRLEAGKINNLKAITTLAMYRLLDSNNVVTLDNLDQLELKQPQHLGFTLNSNSSASETLKDIRINKLNMTQAQVASELGITRSGYSQMELGKAKITLTAQAAIMYLASCPAQTHQTISEDLVLLRRSVTKTADLNDTELQTISTDVIEFIDKKLQKIIKKEPTNLTNPTNPWTDPNDWDNDIPK